MPTNGTVSAGQINAIVGGTVGNVGGTSGSTIVSDQAAPLLSLAVTGNKAIINWGSFDIAAGKTVTFSNVVPTADYAVLNRVLAPISPTLIAGSITGVGTGKSSIFVINEMGISFAGSASVTNISGFVASSLDISDTAFSAFATGADTQIGFAPNSGTGITGITIAAGATITPNSVLLLVAPALTIGAATLSATGGDAGFVVAADATVTLNPNSLIAVKINKGTNFAANGESIIGATVQGQRVLVAAATDITATLLGVTGNLTAMTPTPTDHGIVIAVGKSAPLDASHIIDTTAAPAAADLVVSGTLTSSARVDVVASGAATLAGVSAMGGVGFASDGALTLGGNVSAMGDLTASGSSITLGATGSSHSLKATAAMPAPGAITLTASGGGGAAITTLGNYSINAAGAVVLQQSLGTPANVTQNDSLAITGSSVSVGNIALATTLPTAIGNGDVALTANGANTTDAVVAGTVAAQSAITASSTKGSVTLGGATSGNGVGMMPAPQDVTVTAAGLATVSGPVVSTGNYVVSGGDVSLGGTGIAQSAAGDVVIQAATGDLGGTGTLTADSLGAGGHSLVLDTQASGARINAPALNVSSGAASNIYLSTTGDLSLGTVNARAVESATLNLVHATPPVAGDYTVTTANTVAIPGAITLGTVTVVQPVTIASTALAPAGSAVSVGAVSSGGAIAVSSATGAVTVAGAMSGGMANDVTVSAAGVASVPGVVSSTGNYNVTGSGVSLGGANIVQTAAGDVLIKSTVTDIAVATTGTGVLIADSGATAGHVLVLDTAASITGGGNLTAGTASDVLLAFANPTAGNLTLGSITAHQFASTTSQAVPTTTLYAAAATADTVTAPGSATLGVVTTVDANTIGSADGTSLTSDSSFFGAVKLNASAGNVTVGDLVSGSTGDVTVTATGVATVSGSVNAAGAYFVTGDSVILGHQLGIISQEAAGDVAIKSTGGTITAADVVSLVSNAAATSGAGQGTLTLTAATNIGDAALPGSFFLYGGPIGSTPATRRAVVLDVTASPTGSISVGAVTGASLTGPGALPLTAGGPVALGDVDVTSDLTVTTLSTLSLASGLATGNISLTGTTITLGRALVPSSLATATGTATATLTASAGGAAAIITLGDFTISAPGAVVLQRSMATPANVMHDDSLAITGSSVSVGDINLAAMPPTLVFSGNVVLTASGALPTDSVVAGTITARNAVALSSASGAVTLGGATSGTEGASAHDVTVTAATNADVSGGVISAGDYNVVGHSVTLGNAAAGIVQTAVGNLYIRSGSNVFASGTLVADSGGAGSERLVIDASPGAIYNSASGPVSLIAGPVGGTPTSDILLSLGNGGNLSLGTVAANQFALATLNAMHATPPVVGDYTPVTANTVATSGAITLGAVTTVQSNAILSSGTMAGQRDVVVASDNSIGGSVEVGASNGNLTLTGPVTAATSVKLHADDLVLTVGDVTATAGDATLTGGSGIAGAGGHLIAASGNVALKSDGDVTVDTVRAGGTLTVGGAISSVAQSLTATALRSNSDVTVAVATTINLAAGNSVAALGNVALNAGGSVTVDTVRAGGTLTIVGATNNPATDTVTANSLLSNGALSVTAGGVIDLTGGLMSATEHLALNPTTLATFDGLPVPNASVTLTSTGGSVEASQLISTGDLKITAPGLAFAGSNVTAGGNYTVIGGDVSLAVAGLTQSAAGDVLIRSTSGDVSFSGTIAADSGGTGTRKLVVDSFGAITGQTSIIGGVPQLVGGSLRSGTGTTAATLSDVLLRTGVGQSITLGDISANRLATATTMAMSPMTVGDYAAKVSGSNVGTLQSDGAITLGQVTTAASNAILAIGPTQGQRNATLAGDTSTGGSVEVGSSHGAVSISGLVSADTAANLHADGAADPMDATAGTLSLATVKAFGGDATLLGATGITVATGDPVAALGNVNLLSGGAIVVDAIRAGGIITVAGLTPGTGAASLHENGLAAHGGISITTTGAIDVTPSGLPLSTPRPQIDADLGAFTTNPNNTDIANIALTSTMGSVKAAGISATGSVTLNATTTATVTGDVEAGASGGSGNYIVTGAQVVLGGAATTQKAKGDVWLRSTSGRMSLAGTFAADDAGTGGRRLVLDSAGAIGQVPTAIPGSPLPAANLTAGLAAAHLSDVLIRQGDDTQAITLGNITANQLATAVTTATPPLSVADYTVPVPNTVTTAGPITLGAVNTLQSSTIISNGTGGTGSIVVGGDMSRGAVMLTTNGSITANGPVVAASVDLTAGSALTIGDVTANNGDATLTGGTIGATAGTHAVTASGTVILASPGAITLTADAVSGAAITVGGSSGPNSVAGSFAADSLAATGPITVATSGDIMLVGVHATSLLTTRPAPMAADGNATLTSSGGAITINDATTTGSLSLDAHTAATATGGVTVGDAATLVANRNYSVTGGTIALGALGIVQSATGNIALASPGMIAVSTLLAGGTISADGLTAGSGAGSFGGTTLQANGAIAITTSGAIALAGVGAAGSATERAAFSPTLRTFSGGNVGDADLMLTSHNSTIMVADLASTGATQLKAAGAVSASGNVATGDADTTAGAGGYTVIGSAITLGGGATGQSARDAILLETSGTITLTALRAGGAITADGLTAGSGAAALTGSTLQANGKISVTTNGAILLTGTGAAQTTTERAAFNPTLRTFSGGSVADADVVLTSSGSTVMATDLGSTGNLSLAAAGLASVAGIVTVGGATTAVVDGNYSVSGGTIVLGGPGVVQSATGNITLGSPGSITVSTLLAGGSIFAAGPGGATPLAGSFAGVTLQANGAIGVATAGAITLTGTDTAKTATERTAFDPTLRTFTLVGGPAVADQNIGLASSTGSVSAADLASTGNIALSAGGGVSVSGVVAAGDGSTLSGHGDYSVLGTSIGLGGGASGQAALGNISLQTPGAITLTALRAGGTITARGVPVGATPTNAASLVGDSLEANGAITVATNGAITLAGTPAGVVTERQLIDANLGGFNGAATAPDASINLTATGLNVSSTPGTITVHGGSSTGNIVLAAGTSGGPVGHGAIIATGTFDAGDSRTASGSGDFTAGAYDIADVNAATIGARHSIGITSQTNDALIGTATAGQGALGGSITAQTFASGLVHGSTGAVASIQSGTTTLGDIQALATGSQGTAIIASGTATRGNILADGNAAATITLASTLGTTGDITAHSQSGNAMVTNGSARGSVRALAGAAALVGTGIAANGNVDALGGTTATIASGMASSSTAALGNVRATSTGGGLATITNGSAAQSVVASGGSVLVGSAMAGDDIVLIASSGAATATTLAVTGAAVTEAAATDASGAALVFGGSAVTGLGGSNVIVRAGGAATVNGIVSVAQADITKSANYDVQATSVTLGANAAALSQGAAGRVDINATGGNIVFLGTGGQLTSNVGGNRVANSVAGATVAGGGLTLSATGSVNGATTNLVATARALPSGYDIRADQPGVMVTAGGSVQLATVTGGPVAVTAPVVVDVPLVTSWGDVVLAGSPGLTDTAIIMPVQVVIDGLNAGATNHALTYVPANVTVAGGGGAEVASLTVANGGLVGALQVLSNGGAATLRATPSDPTKIASILVESQTGVAGILNTVGGPASSANPNTVAAQNIVLRGGQTGSSVVATGPLLATGSIVATGPSVTIGTAAVTGTAADGSGDILIAATNTASLAAGAAETAVARRTINLTGGAATLGDGTATGGTLAVDGTTVTVLRKAVAGDDVVLTSAGAVVATNASILTNGTVDLQSGDDTAVLGIASVGSTTGTGYGAGHAVITNVTTSGIDAVTGGSLTRLAGSNIIATAAGNIGFDAATLAATAGRDIHVEAAGTVTLATATAARQFVGASGGTFTATGSIAAGDDLVIGSGAGIDVRAATLSTTGGAAGATDARRADGTLLAVPAAGGALTNLAGSNIALAAAGPIQLGAIATSAAPSSLRAFSNGAVTTTQSISTSGDIALVGATVDDTYGLTAGDDIVTVARGGAATLTGPLTTTGMAISNAALVDLAGNGIALPGETALGRVDGSSILVAASGTATISTTVTSAGRYSVYGRNGIVLGTAGAATSQSAAGDVLLEASIGPAPVSASVSLADGMVLTANSDGVEAARVGGFVADPLVIRVGNGGVAAAGATLRVLRTPNATLADQGTVQIQPDVADGVTSIVVQTIDSASADLRALGDVTIGSATVDAGLTLASKAGAVALTTLTVGTSVPLMTAAEVAAIDVKLSGASGAMLGTVTTGANLVRDITVATVGGDAIIATASARDDIVVASTNGRAIAGDLTFAGTASDSEVGVAAVAATDANGVALPDPYGLTGTSITGLAGRNIVVSGATAASLNSVTTAASDSLGDVRVLTAAGPATLTTVNTGGAGLPARVIVATRNGVATGTTLNASGDIIVDATAGSAVLTSGNAGRDGIVVAPTVSIGTLTAGDDIVAVATGGTLTAGTLTSTGTNSGDGITTVFRADGTSIVDPAVGGIVGNLAGGNVVALATGDVTVTSATATAAPGAATPGLVRLGSQTGTVSVTTAAATAGDLVLSGPVITAATLSAGRDATITTTGVATLPQLTAGRDITITAASADLGDGGLVAAQRNLSVTTLQGLTIGTARAGGMLTATGGTVAATTLAAGDALTVTATAGDATVVTASSTGLPLLADYTGFATTGAAPGTMRDVSVTATGNATLGTATALDTIALTGSTTADLTTATANFITVTAGSGGATIGSATAGEDVTVNAIGQTTIQQANAGRDASVTVTGTGTTTIDLLTAGRDVSVVAGGAASLGADTGLVAAQRNLALTAASLTVGTARAGATLIATGGTVTAATLASGDALTVNATGGDATVNSASSTGLPLLADFSGFAATGTALGATRDIAITASGAATLTTGVAAHGIGVSGGSAATVVTAAANTGGTDGDLTVTSLVGNASLGTGSGRDVSVIATGGNATAGSATALRDIALTAGDAATLTLGSAYDVNVAGNTVVLDRVSALHDVTAVGAITGAINTATAGHSISLTGGDVTLTTATANTGGTDGDLLVSASSGNALLGSGSARDIRVVAAGAGSATATTAAASRDLYVDAQGGTATLTTGTAGRDAVIDGKMVTIGTLTAGDDLVAVATGGPLTAASLTSTGTDSSDGSATIARYDGTAVLDSTVTGSPPVGNLAGGNVIALASGDLTVGTATATAAPGATALGLVRLASLGTTTVTTATATAGDVVVAGSTVAGGILNAGRDVTVTAAAGDVGLTTVSSGRDLALKASNDVVVTGGTTAGGQATLTAGRDIDLGATATGDALHVVGGNATLVSGRDIIVARPVTVGLALAATAGGAGTFAGTASGGATNIRTQGNLILAADTAATGALALTSANGTITAPNISGNGITLTSASAATVTGTAASSGDLTATGGSLSFGTIAKASTATLHATGALVVSGSTTTGGSLTATSDTGSITMGAVTTGGAATLTASDASNGSILLASLGTTGAATLLAGQSATVTGLAQTSGVLTATATNGGLSFGAIDSGAAATLRARNVIAVAGLAAAAGTLDTQSSAGAVTLGSTKAATVTLRGATGVTILGSSAATGPVTITADAGPVTTGDIAAGSATAVSAATGAITLASVSQTAGLTLAAATDATVTGNINSSGDVGVTATSGSATLGSVGNAGKLSLAAAINATIGGSVQTSADTVIVATNGSATVGGAVKTANYTIRADNGTIALGTTATATQASSGTVTLDSQRLTLGTGLTLVASKQIQLDVTGNAAGVSLGDFIGVPIDATRYTLNNAAMGELQSPTVQIAAGGLPVDIGVLNLDNVTSAGGGYAIGNALGIATTGNIRVSDAFTFMSDPTAPRVLTLGGISAVAGTAPTAVGGDLDKSTPTANAIEVLVGQAGLDNTAPGVGGQINGAGSIIQLRASYIALGETLTPPAGQPFITALLPAGGTPLTIAATKTQYVDNASSTLYVAIPPYNQAHGPQALVTAGTLVLAPGQWALIQNTGQSTTPGGGIVATTLKLNKVAGAAAPDPEIAVFGSIAGKTGIASAISVSADNLDGISPNNIRVNGCVALSTAGCIQSAISIPLINLADPGQSLLISNSPDLALSVELITGATNEALWREDDDSPGQNRPQRESRP